MRRRSSKIPGLLWQMWRGLPLLVLLSMTPYCSGSGGFQHNPSESTDGDSTTKDPPDSQSADPRTDAFVQSGYDGKVDIVWMIDSSGSMNEEQQNIVTNAKIFTDQLATATVDYRMIVVTADAGEGCQSLQSACGILSSSSMSIEEITSQFQTCARVGTSGNGYEEGIESVRRALDPNYTAEVSVQSDKDSGVCESGVTQVSGVRNPGFLRSDAHLHVIFVSDEEDETRVRWSDPSNSDARSWDDIDQIGGVEITDTLLNKLREEMTEDLSYGGTGPNDCNEDNCEGRPVDGRERYFPLLDNHYNFFVNELKNGRADLFTAHAIVLPHLNGPDNCHTRTNDEEVGKRYMTFAHMTGGSTADSCNSSWAPTMRALGLQAAGLQSCFTLAQAPSEANPPSITSVTVGGLAQVLGTDFRYEPIGHQVCFMEIPPPGAEIRVTYY